MKKLSEKDKIRHFFKAWQKEFPNFKTPKLKKIIQKKDYVVAISGGRGIGEPSATYDATAFKYVKGRLSGQLGKPKVRGFKRVKAKRFKDEVKARAYAKKMLEKLK